MSIKSKIKDALRQMRVALMRRRMRGLPALPELDGTTVIVAPHPDDEVIGCGGLIAHLCAEGRPPHVVILTRGEGSHRSCCDVDPHELANARHNLTLQAAKITGLPPENIHQLNFPDGAVVPKSHEDEQLREAAALSVTPLGAPATSGDTKENSCVEEEPQAGRTGAPACPQTTENKSDKLAPRSGASIEKQTTDCADLRGNKSVVDNSETEENFRGFSLFSCVKDEPKSAIREIRTSEASAKSVGEGEGAVEKNLRESAQSVVFYSSESHTKTDCFGRF